MVKLLHALFAFVCRSVTYSVNNFHKHHVTVLAEVVPVDLELSTEDLVLKPSYGLPADAGMVQFISLDTYDPDLFNVWVLSETYLLYDIIVIQLITSYDPCVITLWHLHVT